jgi:crotonobetainyl-CoA:carnitine CoA-transferase CaiB-like acyl-CoA transferase
MSGIQTEGHFEEFCARVGRKDLLDDPRFATGTARQAHTRECIGVLDEIFAARDLAEWATILARLSTPWSIVQSAAEAAVDPQTAASHYLAEVQGARRSFPLVASPAQFDHAPTTLTRAPDHGEHTEEILLELGRDWDDIAHPKEIGAVL